MLYDSPHSGRFYPADWKTQATGPLLRQGEDAYVDELLAGTTASGAVVLTAVYPRCYIDVNREESDIDVELLSEPWPDAAPTDKTARGLGLIRRYVTPGVEVNTHLLAVADVRQRIERIYRPYHAALQDLAAEIRHDRGKLLHIDWHSMKSVGNAMTPDGAGSVRPDFVVSDVNGSSAGARVTELVVSTLRGFGYRVSVNDPYTGGTIVRRVGNPARDAHSIQVEINRALYLDEQRIEKTPGFSVLATNIERFTKTCASEF